MMVLFLLVVQAFRGNVFGELNDERKEVSFWGSRMSTFCSSRVLAARAI